MIMTFKKAFIYMMAAVMLCLCGCKEKKIDTGNLEELKDRLEQQAAAEKNEQQNAQGNAQESEQKEEEIPEGLFAKAFADGQIENNGGMFVRVANRVYYRV